MFAISTFLTGTALQFPMADYKFIFIGALITVALTIMLRAFLVTGLQVLLLLTLFILPGSHEIVHVAFLIAQVVLSATVLYKIGGALDMNYKLVLEKIHQSRPNLIKNEHRGSRFSFWKTN